MLPQYATKATGSTHMTAIHVERDCSAAAHAAAGCRSASSTLTNVPAMARPMTTATTTSTRRNLPTPRVLADIQRALARWMSAKTSGLGLGDDAEGAADLGAG